MLQELKSCKDIYSVADLLEIPAKTLTFLLYVLPDTQKYSTACISKKGGGERQLAIPEPRLKDLQRKLANVLYEAKEDIQQIHGPSRSFGFERGRGIFENAHCHRNKRWVFNIDLADFFDSINFGRVISFFKKNTEFALHPKVATYIAQIACFNNRLPQGAPSSPVISNLVSGGLDYRLARLAAKSLCNYSRYADDITFSTNQKQFPETLACSDSSSQGWMASDELVSRIAASGFQLNASKTRMSFRDSRQMVTGLVVNSKPNVPREYYKQSRAAIHHLMRGKQVHVHRFCSPFRLNCEDEEVSTDDFACLEGRISHCYGVSEKSDTRPDKTKFFHPTAVARTYADLLQLKYFVRGSRPIILTEGPSDALYIKAALKSSSISIPNLLEIEQNGDQRILIDFFRFAPRPSRLLGLSGGSGNLGLFIERYEKFVRRLSDAVHRRGLVILLDNDDGLKGTEAKMKTCFGVDISLDKDKDYYQFTKRGFVVKTPHILTKSKTWMENFLDPAALKVSLNGKSFSMDSQFDPSTHFGKVALSHHVYEQRAKYDFTPFQPILERISSALSSA